VNKIIKSSNFSSTDGWCLYPNGDLVVRNGNFRGAVEALSGTFAGILTAGSITISGEHTVSSNNASNTKVVACDNNQVVTNSILRREDFSGGISAYAAKRIRVAGKGNVKFYISYQGRVAIIRQAGTDTWDNLFNNNQLADNGTEVGVWTAEKYLPDDINIIYLVGFDSNYYSSKFKNTTFEVRTSSEPGLFKYLSSPF